MARDTFSNKIGVVAALCGSVVGLGNIWRFPYIAGENGGGAFLIVYILVNLFIATPLLLSEILIGRSSQSNPFNSFRVLTGKKRTLWSAVGLMGVLTAFLITSFYMVISGWGVQFLILSVTDGFKGLSPLEIENSFTTFTSNGWRPLLFMVIFAIGNYLVSIMGIRRGIEKFVLTLMPIMIILLIILIINSLMLPNAMEGVKFLLYPDFSKMSLLGVLKALGQSFYSLSIGMGAAIIYGSYIKKDINIYKTAATVAICDVSVAILSGLVIFPSAFSFGISPTAGPELIFITLPNIFQQMTGGYLVSIVFFFIVIAAAITSSLSLIESVIAFFIEEFKLSRIKAASISMALLFIVSSMCVISMMPDSALQYNGKSLIDILDGATGTYTLPLGGLLTCIFTGWILDKKILKAQITNNESLGPFSIKIYNVVRFIIRYIAHIVIAFIFLDALDVI